MKNINDFIFSKIPKPIRKYLKYILVALAVLILMLVVTFPTKKDEKAIENTAEITAETYINSLQDELEKTIKSIVGGSPNVMITLKSGIEYVYANEEKLNSDTDNADERLKDSSEKKVVILESDGTQKPLTVTQIMPAINGIVIVCNGGNDASVQQLIRSTVSTALGIESERVCVTGTLLK